MKNIKKLLLLLIILLIPIFISAKTDTYESSVSKANQYIFNSVFESRSKYLYYDNPLYGVDNSGNVMTSLGYTTGGMLNAYEYEVSLKNGFSYLVIPNKFWTMSISDNNLPYYLDGKGIARSQNNSELYETRVTQIVKPKTVVTGEGTLNNPWEFVNANYAILTTSDINLGYFCSDNNECSGGNRKAREEKVINSDKSVTFDIFVKKGYENDTSDGCKLIKVSSTPFTSTEKTTYKIENINGDYNCVVKFKAKTYMITYNKNTTDTVSNMPVNQSKTHGTNITLSNSTPTRTGYTFDGWYEYSSCTGTMYSQGGNYTNNSNVTLYAKWKINSHVITFNANGGKFSNGTDTFKITQNYGTSITKPADPTRVGHTFKGWNKEVPSTMPDQDITITANEWQVNQYTITFNTKGGSTIEPITQNYGTSITKPANPTKTGYTFAGWDKEVPSTMPAQSMTITAKNWTPKTVKVTFNRNTSSSDTTTLSQTFTYAASGNKFGYNTNGTPTWAQTGQFGGWDRTGYKLLGWSTDKNATTATYSVYSGINDSWINSNSPSVTLYAIWKINQYTITFNTAGGSTIAPITQNYGTSITKPANPTKAGYSFIGWDKTIPSTMPAQSMTITAKWGYARFAAGETVNAKMKTLANGSNVTYDSKIRGIYKASSLKSGLGNNNIVSTSDSTKPIYMWYENNAIYYYSEINSLLLNSNSKRMFYGLTALSNINALSNFYSNDTTTMEEMFLDCTSITNFNPLQNWNTSKVTNLHGFINITDASITANKKCGSLTSLSGLSKWNVGNVTTLEEFVQDHPNLTNYSGLENWDVRKVTSIYSAFGLSAKGYDNGCRAKVTTLSALSNWKTNSLQNMRNAFRSLEKVTNLTGLAGWDVSKVSIMRRTFSHMYNLQNVDALSNWKTNSLTDMEGMFYSDISLSSINGLSGFNTSKVTTMEYTFNINDKTVTAFNTYGKISSLQPLRNWNTSNVTTMHAMFQDQLKFTQVTYISGWNMGKVTSLASFLGPSNTSRNKGFTCYISDKNTLNGWAINADRRSELNARLGRCSG